MLPLGRSLNLIQLTSLGRAGQVVTTLATLSSTYHFVNPNKLSISAVVEKLQSIYLESVNAGNGVRMQQYLHPRSDVYAASYTLQAVGGWRQRKQASWHNFEQACIGWQWRRIVTEL